MPYHYLRLILSIFSWELESLVSVQDISYMVTIDFNHDIQSTFLWLLYHIQSHKRLINLRTLSKNVSKYSLFLNWLLHKSRWSTSKCLPGPSQWLGQTESSLQEVYIYKAFSMRVTASQVAIHTLICVYPGQTDNHLSQCIISCVSSKDDYYIRNPVFLPTRSMR